MIYKKQKQPSKKREKSHGKSSKRNSTSDNCKYKISLKPAAFRGLSSLGNKDQQRITKKIDSLIEDPYPDGVRKLRGSDNRFRLRVGNFRIIYSIVKDELTILVINIGDRKDIYRK